MKNIFFIITLLLALAGLGYSVPQKRVVIPVINIDPTEIANKGTSALTDKCQKTVNAIITNPDLPKCLPIQQLISLISDPTILKQVIADPIHNLKLLVPTFDAICALPKCSDDLAGNIANQIIANCQEDLAKKDQLVEALFVTAVVYSPARDSICFKNPKNPKKDYCLIETVDIIGTLPKSPFTFLHNPLFDSISVAPPELICTSCNKAITNTLLNYYKGNHPLFVTLLTTLGVTGDQIGFFTFGADLKCGLPFTDGVADPTIPAKCNA